MKYLALLLALLASAARATPPTFDDVSGLDGLRIVNETISDNPAIQAVPDPVTWNTAVTDDFRFNCFTICVETGLWGDDEQTVARSAGSGATLISPSFAFVTPHVPGTGVSYVWMEPDGDEVTRSRLWFMTLSDDVGLIKLDAPVTTIEPAAILTDMSAVGGSLVACLEHDRHINVMTVASSIGGATHNSTAGSSYVWRMIAGGDEIEGGDSGKTCLAFIDGRPVLVMTAISGALTSAPYYWAVGPNLSSLNVSLVASKLAEAGETLTLIDSAPDEDNPDPPAPGRYHVRTVGDSAVTVGGIPLTFDIEE